MTEATEPTHPEEGLPDTVDEEFVDGSETTIREVASAVRTALGFLTIGDPGDHRDSDESGGEPSPTLDEPPKYFKG